MKKVGAFLHKVEGYVIAKAEGKPPSIGTPLYYRGRKVGVVVDIIGPVGSPYLVIKGDQTPEYYSSKG